MVLLTLRRCANRLQSNSSGPWSVTTELFSKNWLLGLTAFGGPPVHFQIVGMLF